MENIIIVPSVFDSEKVLIWEQKIWSAVEISDSKIKEIKYLAIYRTQDEKYEKNLQSTLFGLYEVIWYEKITTPNHDNFGKYILFIKETNEKFSKKSPRIYQARDYMNYQDFMLLPNV